VPSSGTAPATPTVPADVPTTGPNANAGEKPPVMPIAATQHTAAGAQAFAKFFIQTIDWGYATTSTTYMRHYFDRRCVGCTSISEAIDGASARNRRFVGDRFTIRSAVNGGAGGPNSAELSTLIHFDVTSAEVVAPDGGYVAGQPALTDYRERVYETWRGNGWAVVELVVAK
jgi:hypothetical protein